jgi:serine/arginine repetitive matrix protein 1
MQINITGFLNGKNARVFMKELWELLLSAQDNIGGIPTAFLEKKKEEIRQRKVRSDLFQGNCFSQSLTGPILLNNV